MADEHAGKHFRCKGCQEVLQVPGEPPAAAGASDTDDAWIRWIQEGRDAGQTRRQIREDLIAEGFSRASASQMIEEAFARSRAEEEANPVAARRAARRREAVREKADGLGEWSWLLWIGALAFINLLSWLFDWSFWIY